MKMDDYIDNYVKSKKDVKANPFLVTRIMNEIENEQQLNTIANRSKIWQTLAVSFSIVAVMFLGISIGNSLAEQSNPQYIININDSQMERLDLYQIN